MSLTSEEIADFKQLMTTVLSQYLGEVATKDDIAELRTEIRSEMKALEKRLTRKVETEIETLDEKIDLIQEAIAEVVEEDRTTLKEHERRITRLEHAT